jgi:hypothetical protein
MVVATLSPARGVPVELLPDVEPASDDADDGEGTPAVVAAIRARPASGRAAPVRSIERFSSQGAS